MKNYPGDYYPGGEVIDMRKDRRPFGYIIPALLTLICIFLILTAIPPGGLASGKPADMPEANDFPAAPDLPEAPGGEAGVLPDIPVAPGIHGVSDSAAPRPDSGTIRLPGVNYVSYPSGGTAVLMYHSISESESNSLCVSAGQFERELRWLREKGYHSVGINDFARAISGSEEAEIPERAVLITFDDGYLDNYTNAAPLLKQYGYTATFFIITELVGSPGYMSYAQIAELLAEGHSAGSHSAHHHDLTTLSREGQYAELSESKRQLEEELGIEVIAFCHPSGRYDDTTIDLLSEAGYTLAFTTKSGLARRRDGLFELKRIRVWNGMKISQLERKLP